MGSMKKAALYRLVTAEHICPFGLKSKELLERNGFDVDDFHLKSSEEAQVFKQKHGVITTPQTFIDKKRVGGYDDLQAFFGKKSSEGDGVSYQPVIAVFGVTLLMALAASWFMTNSFPIIKTVELFIAFSMCVLAILKLRDLESFSNQFLNYDLLAKRWVSYAYIYPVAEAVVGIGMIASTFTIVIASIALFIGSVGSISVFKAVYIDKRELKCACVGGDSKVPLGFISLTENLMMVFMALWMFLRP